MLGMLQYVPRREHKEFYGIVWPNMDGRGCYKNKFPYGVTRFLTIKIATRNFAYKVSLKPYYLNYANNIILAGGTPL
jgi:hypothetical protein